MSEKYRCPVCEHDIEGDLITYLEHTKKEMLEILKKKYPNWDEKKGLCPKCKEEFESWFDSHKKESS